MTVRVERTLEFETDPERVWSFVADPGRRADAISVVDSYETDGDETVWHVRLPIPFLDRTVAVRTRDVEREPPRSVRFVGRSRVLHVTGEHEVEPIPGGARLTNRFVVEGNLPGVESFFERNLDGEIENLERALRTWLREERTA